MKTDVSYDRKNSHIEYIYYQNAARSYPTHTHANHAVIGLVWEGEVRVACDGEEEIYCAGESFCIMPDVPHAVGPVNGAGYSMITACVFVDQISDESSNGSACLGALKREIMDAPENEFLIADMARRAAFSPYHMIRRFKAAYGLPPHQFQIQCRVRMAQRLLEQGKSATEAAYAAGFCDQSHFNRCFHKIVQLTPGEYRQSSTARA